MEDPSPRPTDDDSTATVLYIDSEAGRRANAVAEIRSVDESITVETASDTDVLSTVDNGQFDGVVIVDDPPELDARVALENLDLSCFTVLRAPPDRIVTDAEQSSPVDDYYLLDVAHDEYVADRIVSEATAAVAQDWQAIIERMTDAFFALDKSWEISYVNNAAVSILSAAMNREDADHSTLQGLHFWEEIPEAVDTVFYEQYTHAMESQQSVKFQEYYDPLDTWFEVRVYPSETGISVYFRDVTDRRERRELLVTRERVLREMYSVIADVDRSFSEKVTRLLEIGCEFLGTSYGTLSQIDGEDYIFEAVHAPDDTIEVGDVVPLSATNCERTVSDEQTLVLEDIADDAPELAERAGYTDWGISCYIGAPVAVDGEMYGTFCFYDETPRDEPFGEWEITLVDLISQWLSYELERLETQADLETQNERLEQFASIVGHDLRNPLNVAASHLELARDDYDDEHLDAVKRAHDRMVALIDDLLVLAREGDSATEETTLSLPQTANLAWDQVETDDATLVVETDETLAGDPGHVQRLLENLFRNATEHAESRVTVTVGDTDDGWYVADDGPGIPTDRQSDIFEAGYTTNSSGTGLGLAIVERLAEAHGWEVSVTEGEDGGARFEFSGVTW